ncbi:MAG: hypothetical protein KGJ32_02030 [Xanthomonadaceae bacterium]|nr:hypothetical protein [Xanthomonadaceae bacterium]
MNRHIHRYAVAFDQLACEVAGKVGALLGCQLGRKSKDPLPRGARILALLRRFGRVPERLTVASEFTCVAWRHDERCRHARAAGEIVRHAGARIDQRHASTIRRCRHGRATGAAGKRLCGGVVNGDGIALGFGFCSGSALRLVAQRPHGLGAAKS